jgi:hypothetical protein
MLAAAAGIAGRLVLKTDLFETERLYAKVVAVDRDRAHDDVYYVGQRLRLLAMATDNDPDELVRGAARALVAFVTTGRPFILRLDEVEQACAPLREATEDQQAGETVAGLLPAYLDAWHRALT